MAVPRRITFAVLAALPAAGCTGFAPPRPDLSARIAAMPIAGRLPGQFEFEIASAALTGTFDAVLAVQPGGCQVQLFPDVGGKVLDLQVGRQRVVADVPGGHYVATPPFDRAPPHLGLLLAAVFAELTAPMGRERLLGERPLADGRTEVLLRMALGSGTAVATLGAEGGVQAYAFTLGRLCFSLEADGSLRAPGLFAQIRPR